MDLNDPRPAADEYTTLTEFLDYFRAVLYRKSEGLTSAQAHTPLAPSNLTIGSLLRHMSFVEDFWFIYTLSGQQPTPPWDTAPWETSPDWDLETATDFSLAQLQADYLAAIDCSRAVLAASPNLDALAARGEPRNNLRWVLVHMIEEYARHCGHADFIREHLDGAVGD